ncbi:MAG: hypothetical protein GYA85_08775, partial [Propionibacterium sp.]|nr:hypothetical protein [Propionibacterium sp.]
MEMVVLALIAAALGALLGGLTTRAVSLARQGADEAGRDGVDVLRGGDRSGRDAVQPAVG